MKKEVIKTCPNCGTKFKVLRVVKNGIEKIPKKEKTFCSRKCSCSVGGKASKGTKKKVKTVFDIECKICKTIFKAKTRNSKFCSDKCLKENRRSFFKNRDRKDLDMYVYRNLAKFNFSVYKYPDYFDLNLLEKFGWFSTKSNIQGISRDHLYSVKDGFNNKVDPLILAHPANCKLMKQTDNASKHTKSSITLEELLEKINEWDIKYGKY